MEVDVDLIGKLKLKPDPICRDAADELEFLSKERNKMSEQIAEMQADMNDMINCLGVIIRYLMTQEEFKDASPEEIMDWIEKNVELNRHLLDARTDH